MKLLLLLSLFGLVPCAFAETKGDCGTIIIPTGLGVSSSADITSMNPLLGTSTYNAEVGDMMFMQLVWINRFSQIDWQRSLASAITTPDNGTTFDVTLRPWHWSDGVPVTAADVAYTFSLIKRLGTTYSGYGLGGMPDIIKSLTINNPRQFQVVLKRQVNPTWFIYNGLGQLMPLPAHDWGHDTLDEIWQNQSSPAFYHVVDGPLKMQRLEVGLDAVMVPNPSYEGPKLHFNRLMLRFLESDSAALQGVESGELDMVNLPVPVWNAVQHLPGIYIVILPPQFSWNNIQLNFNNPQVAFFRDVRVRQAIQDAIDQPTMIRLVQHGLGVAIYAPIPPPPSRFIAPALRDGHYPVGFDPGKARALLKQAGYAPGPDGIMQHAGVRLAFTDITSAGDAQIEQQAELIQAGLRNIGIDMKIHEIDFNLLLALVDGPSGGWQAAEYASGPQAYPSGELSFSTGGYYNNGGYSDKMMDALIQASVAEPGMDALFKYEEYASAQQPVIFFASTGVAVLARNRIHGVQDFVSPADGAYSPEQLYCTGAS
jgi:peptide/nickel transport system substrate-binding protein